MTETGATETKTHLRVLFEESMKAPSQFSFFGSQSSSSAEEVVVQQEEGVDKLKELKKLRKDTQDRDLRPLTEVFLLAEQELNKRWPEPVGKKFIRSEEGMERWQETKEKLKVESRKRLKEAVRKGMAKPAVKKPK